MPILRFLQNIQTHAINENEPHYWLLRLKVDFRIILRFSGQLSETAEHDARIKMNVFIAPAFTLTPKEFYQFLWIRPRIQSILKLREEESNFFHCSHNYIRYTAEDLTFLTNTLNNFEWFNNDFSDNDNKQQDFIDLQQKIAQLNFVIQQYHDMIKILAANHFKSYNGGVFHCAVYYDLPLLVTDLLVQNVDPNCLNQYGRTALCQLLTKHHTFYINQELMIELLLEAGTDPRILDNTLKNALHHIATEEEIANLDAAGKRIHTKLRQRLVDVVVVKDQADKKNKENITQNNIIVPNTTENNDDKAKTAVPAAFFKPK